MEKVLIITYYWPPSGGSGVQRWLKFVKYLGEYDIRPYVLTIDSGYAAYSLTDAALEKDVPDNVEVFRTRSRNPYKFYRKLNPKKNIPHTGFSGEKKPGFKEKVFRFVRGNFFIPDSRRGWNGYARKKAMELIRRHGIRHVITSSPPHSTQLIGRYLKKRAGVSWIADLRDPWTDIYYYNEFLHTLPARKRDAYLERKVLEEADHLVVVSERIKQLFAAKSTKVNADKIAVIPNGYDETDFRGTAMEQIPGHSEWVISYTGNLASDHAPIAFLEAFREIVYSQPSRKPLLRFIGTCPPAVVNFMKENGIADHFEAIPYVPHDESVSYLLKSDALLLVIPNVPHNEGILTGKLFEYLAARKPIINIGPPDGDADRILLECEAGRTFGYEDFSNLENYMRELLKQAEAGKDPLPASQTFKKYARKTLTKRIAELIKS